MGAPARRPGEGKLPYGQTTGARSSTIAITVSQSKCRRPARDAAKRPLQQALDPASHEPPRSGACPEKAQRKPAVDALADAFISDRRGYFSKDGPTTPRSHESDPVAAGGPAQVRSKGLCLVYTDRHTP